MSKIQNKKLFLFLSIGMQIFFILFTTRKDYLTIHLTSILFSFFIIGLSMYYYIKILKDSDTVLLNWQINITGLTIILILVIGMENYFLFKEFKDYDLFLFFFPLISLIYFACYFIFRNVEKFSIYLLVPIASCLLLPFIFGIDSSDIFTLIFVFIVGIVIYSIFSLTKYFANDKNQEIDLQEDEKAIIVIDPNKPKKKKIMSTSLLLHLKNSKKFITFISFIFPLICLLINNSNGMFGDFSNIWFFIILTINSISLIIDFESFKYKKILLFFRIFGLFYVSYFALIFLPYVPIGFVGIIYFGLGLLIFVPLVLFIFELWEIIDNIRSLKSKQIKTFAIILAGAFLIPILILIHLGYERQNILNAREYINFESDTNKKVNVVLLEKSIYSLQDKSLSFNFFSGRSNSNYIPILSQISNGFLKYSTSVTDEEIFKIYNLFFPERIYLSDYEYLSRQREDDQSLNNFIKESFDTKFNISDSVYNEEFGYYETWINFEVKSLKSVREFFTSIKINEGVFINDYYLDVFGVRKKGILSDKRAADTIYGNIVAKSLDPGIIYYEDNETLTLKVFPFEEKETRKFGFKVIHRGSETILFGNTPLKIDVEKENTDPIKMQNTIYIPKEFKNTLQKGERKPIYYFIIDGTSKFNKIKSLKQAEEFILNNNIIDYKYVLASYDVKIAEKNLDNIYVHEGGSLNLNNSIMKIIKDVGENNFPVIVTVSEMKFGITEKVGRNLYENFPESKYYYFLDKENNLRAFEINGKYFREVNVFNEFIFEDVLVYENKFISSENKNKILYISKSVNTQETNDLFKKALNIFNKVYFSTNHIEEVETIKESFKSNIMTKLTSFIVVETKQQELDLLLLQEKYLSGDYEDFLVINMAEPSFIFIGAFLFILYVIHIKRKNRID